MQQCYASQRLVSWYQQPASRYTRLAAVLSALILVLGFPLTGQAALHRAGIWSPAAPMPTNHGSNAPVLLADGTVLIAGSTTADRYDPVADRWLAAGDLTTYRTSHTATRLPDGRVLLTGGLTPTFDAIAASERYDPATSAWTATAPMSSPRLSHTATLLTNGQVLVVGGTPDAKVQGLATAERYDPTTDRWSSVASLSGTRVGHTATLLNDGTVLVVGGANVSLGGGQSSYVAAAERYDPVRDRWTAAGAPGSGRIGHQAAVLPDGRVLIFGGVVAPAGTRLPDGKGTVETSIYDPQTNAWTVGAPMVTPRRAFASTVLADGRILVISGDKTNMATEIFDSRTNQWQAGPPVSSEGTNNAILLADGRVLVTHETLTEIFTPNAPAPPERCFSETGYCIRGRFLAYWQAHGGLVINGLPLNDEDVQQINPGQYAAGRYLIAQYFERTRLEYHPRNVGTPYDVLLGQFGRQILAAVPNAPTAPVDRLPDHHYFAETGHNIPADFDTYWRANGGLTQFDYPLTEVFTQQLEDGKSYEVQSFERARFERHPENQAPNTILLGQFGRQILAEQR